jgi:transposase-like protein
MGAARKYPDELRDRAIRLRVLKALNDAAASGEEISVSGIARRAGVDRTFLYRHRDLLGQLHAAEAQPRNSPRAGPTVSRASLQADLLAAQERAARLAARVRQLEHRLSELLGQQAWHESGLGAPADIDALNQKITHLEQHAADLRLPNLPPRYPDRPRRPDHTDPASGDVLGAEAWPSRSPRTSGNCSKPPATCTCLHCVPTARRVTGSCG